MLLGLAANGTTRQQPPLSLQVKFAAEYLADDWRMNNRLTLNRGLRWDSDFPETVRFDRISWFDLDAPLPLHVHGMAPFYGVWSSLARGRRGSLI